MNDSSVSEPHLWLNPTTIFEKVFFIKGSSVSGNSVFKEVLFTVYDDCLRNPQVVTLAEAGTKILTFSKNMGLQNLLSLTELNALFSLGDPNKCLLETFEVLGGDGSPIS